LLTATDLPLGVFDSGVGGLTVLRALRQRLPNESTIYLGDTARVPYGTKTRESVVRYATQATEHLVGRGIKLLVVACNTATALSLPELRARFAPLPVVGVIEPGAEAAVAASRSQRHLVLATESTVKQHAYTQAIHALAPAAKVEEIPCSLFVALAEEGWTEGPIPEAVATKYLKASMSHAPDKLPDTIVLGCTHFPLLKRAIRSAVGHGPSIVDSATTTAEYVAGVLGRMKLLRVSVGTPTMTLVATDGGRRFADVGSRFLDQRVDAADVEIVDL
jgi:glutamate racemase